MERKSQRQDGSQSAYIRPEGADTGSERYSSLIPLSIGTGEEPAKPEQARLQDEHQSPEKQQQQLQQPVSEPPPVSTKLNSWSASLGQFLERLSRSAKRPVTPANPGERQEQLQQLHKEVEEWNILVASFSVVKAYVDRIIMTIVTLNVPNLQHMQSPFNPTPIPLPSVVPVLNGYGYGSSVALSTPMPEPAHVLSLEELCLVQRLTRDGMKDNEGFMRSQGWAVPFKTMEMIFGQHPEVFFLARTFDGRVIGHLSGLRLDPELGMLSYCIVHEDFQNRGIGSRLMSVGKEAMDGRVTCFYAVEEQAGFYKRRGYNTCRFSCLVRHFLLSPDDFSDDDSDFEDGDGMIDDVDACGDAIRMIDARYVPFDKLHEYDTATHGVDRRQFLKESILRPDFDNNHVMAAYDFRSDRVVGYIGLTHSERWDINPLYADNDDIARRLLKAAAKSVGEPIRVHVRIPSCSARAIKLFSGARDLKHKRMLYLMSDSSLPRVVSSDKVYSLSTVCYGLK